MKRINRRLQQLSAGAEKLQHIVNQVPGRVEGVRRSMAAAAEKLQQVRTDLALSAEALRGKAETDAVGLLEEIGEVGPLLDGSGFTLEGVDWDIGATRRLQVHIDRVEPTTVTALRALLAKHDGKPAARMIITALIQAQGAAEDLEMGRLVWTDVVIEIGAVTTVRIGWRELLEEDGDAPPAQGAPPPLPIATVASPHYTPGTFLRPRVPEPVVDRPVAAVATSMVAAPVAPKVKRDPMSLERFKKMPSVRR